MADGRTCWYQNFIWENTYLNGGLFDDNNEEDKFTTLEKETDVLVYKLYELSYDEVQVIDKDFCLPAGQAGLSEAEYENYKME